MTKNTAVKQKPFDFKRDILYPACASFCAVVLGLFSVMWMLGANVTEERDKYTAKYQSDGSIVSDEWLVGESQGLSIGMIVGILLFSLSLFALSSILNQDFDKLTKRIIHFIGTEISFVLFVMLFSGYTSGATVSFGSVMLAVGVVAVVYFLVLLIKLLFKYPLKHLKNKCGTVIYRYVSPIFVIFTATVIITAIVSLFMSTNVEINWFKRDVEDAYKTFQEGFETLTAPIAHTLQNLLRYLGSAAVFMLGLSVFKLRIPKVAKGILNLLICSAGFFLIWFIQMPYFYELEGMILASIVTFYGVYAVSFVAACIVIYVRNRKSEEKDEYIPQFTGRRSKKG